MTGGAESASVRWVVRVESVGDELSPVDWPVVGDGRRRDSADDARDISGEDRSAEASVFGVARVSAFGGAAALSVCLACALLASASIAQVWTVRL